MLYEKQHALLLHWNRLTIPILQKMARAHRFYEGGTKSCQRKVVVVSLIARMHARKHPRAHAGSHPQVTLVADSDPRGALQVVAEKPKAEMDALIDEADGLEGLEIITRSGSPTSGSQLGH